MLAVKLRAFSPECKVPRGKPKDATPEVGEWLAFRGEKHEPSLLMPPFYFMSLATLKPFCEWRTLAPYLKRVDDGI